MRAWLAAGLAAAPTLAMAQLPAIDVEARCREQVETRTAAGTAVPDAFEACLAEESGARAAVAPHWDALPPDLKAACERAPPSTLGEPSYVLLEICVAMGLEQAGLPLPFDPTF